MRLVITQNVTADGAVEMLTDWFDPSDQDQELAAELRRQDESCDAVLLGRQTDDTTGVSDQLNRVTKYVVSATITDPQWRNSVVLAVVLTGSITLAHLLIAEGMADEFRMFCCPAVQGTGRRFFPEGYAARLARVDARTFGNGVTYVACRPTGSHDA